MPGLTLPRLDPVDARNSPGWESGRWASGWVSSACPMSANRRFSTRSPAPPRRRPRISLLHDRAERGRGRGARCAARPAGGDRAVETDRAHPHDLRRHRRAGEGRLARRGPRQPVPRQYPRGRRHRPCPALLRGRRCRACGRPRRSGRRCRRGRDRTDARRSRQHRETPRGPRAQAQGRRQGRRAGRPPAGPRADRARRGQAGAHRRDRRGRPQGVADAATADLQTGALRLQCRRGRRRRRQCPFRGRGADGRRSGRGLGGDLGPDRRGNQPARRRTRRRCS